jgi:hypothetical protein
MRKPIFNILDRVYHITLESPLGIVIDVRYTYSTDMHEYQVSFSAESQSLWYFGHELSTTKTFV